MLPPQRIVNEGRSHEIGQHFQIVQLREISIDLGRKLAPVAFQFRIKLEDFFAQRFGLDRGCAARLDDVDVGYRKRCLLFETGETHALQALEDEIRGAVAASDTSANQSDGGEMKKILGLLPFRATRLYERDAKHEI